MYIYFIVYCFLAFLAFTRKKSNIIFITVFVFLSLFLNLSYTNGIDWVNYQNIYENNPFETRGMEFGFTSLQLFFKSLGFNFEMFKFIVLTFDLFIILKFIFRVSLFPLFSITILFQTFLLGNFFEPAIRQIQAIVIFLFAFKFLVEKKNLKYFATILFGALFHQTALILLILPFILKYITLLSVCVVSTILYLLSGYFSNVVELITSVSIFSSYYYYLDKDYLLGIDLNLFNFAKALIYFFPLFILRKYKTDDQIFITLRKLSYLFFLIYLMQFSIMLFYRVNFYFITFYVLYISYLFYVINSRQICQLLFIFYVCIHAVSLYRGISLFKYKDSMKYYPYTNYFIEYIKGTTYYNSQEKIEHRMESREIDLNNYLKGK